MTAATFAFMVAVAVFVFVVDSFGFAVTLELDEGEEEEVDDDLFFINEPMPKLRFRKENCSFKNFTRKSTFTFSPLSSALAVA